MKTILVMSWVGMGLAQALAMYCWLYTATDAGALGSAALSVFGLFPVTGTVFAIFGAHESWGWSWTESTLFFLVPVLLLIVLSRAAFRRSSSPSRGGQRP
ncbi:MAG TPA: hypothetical protein VJM31_03445 [Vicinamibacterales bacterium]|nr:hypothetical protein [Vicinamibacterales bacterium]